MRCQLSQWHFTAAEPYRQRLIKMGQYRQCIQRWTNGDRHLLNSPADPYIRTDNRLSFGKEFTITFHPETLLQDKGIKTLKNLLSSSSKCLAILFTHPNADDGSTEILCRLDQFVSKQRQMLVNTIAWA